MQNIPCLPQALTLLLPCLQPAFSCFLLVLDLLFMIQLGLSQGDDSRKGNGRQLEAGHVPRDLSLPNIQIDLVLPEAQEPSSTPLLRQTVIRGVVVATTDHVAKPVQPRRDIREPQSINQLGTQIIA